MRAVPVIGELGVNHPSNTHRVMLRDLVFFFREVGGAADDDSKAGETGTRFEEGRAAAYREVLNSIKNHAVSFGVSLEELEELGLEAFDPLSDPLVLPPKHWMHR